MSRQTGFGVAELFGEKAPSAREEKAQLSAQKSSKEMKKKKKRMEKDVFLIFSFFEVS